MLVAPVALVAAVVAVVVREQAELGLLGDPAALLHQVGIALAEAVEQIVMEAMVRALVVATVDQELLHLFLAHQ
jgi:hypothetical protein